MFMLSIPHSINKALTKRHSLLHQAWCWEWCNNVNHLFPCILCNYPSNSSCPLEFLEGFWSLRQSLKWKRETENGKWKTNRKKYIRIMLSFFYICIYIIIILGISNNNVPLHCVSRGLPYHQMIYKRQIDWSTDR